MWITCRVNDREYTRDIEPDLLLIDFVRSLGFKSVKRGCDTSNCGLCTVWLDGLPVLSCSVPAARVNGKKITTLEGLEDRARAVGRFLASEGADQCGFCSPGLIMNVLALEAEHPHPGTDDIRAYLAGNLCRCSGYEGQLRAVVNYFKSREAMDEKGE